MKTLRIFVSAPGDVGMEGGLVAQIVARAGAEFIGRCAVECTVQVEGIDAPAPTEQIAVFDVVVLVLWTRLEDAAASPSRTEQILTACTQARPPPVVWVYFNEADPQLPARGAERVRRNREYDELLAFRRRWFGGMDEPFRAAFRGYDGLADFERRMENDVRKTLEKLGSSTPPPLTSAAPAADGESPFRALRHFEFEDAAIFFGRTQAVGEVLQVVQSRVRDGCAFVLIFGRSGAGKSSLVRAGVLPLLTKPGTVEGVGIWRTAILHPGTPPRSPVDAVAAAPTPGDPATPVERHPPRPVDALVASLAQGLPEILTAQMSHAAFADLWRTAPQAAARLVGQALRQAAATQHRAERTRLEAELSGFERAGRTADAARCREQLATAHLSTPRLAVVVDQLEELFHPDHAPAERVCFIRALDALARSGWAVLLATMRSDFHRSCETIPELLALKEGAGHYDLRPTTPEEISQIIRLPARAAGLTFERHPKTGYGLDEEIRDTAAKDPSILPLLEFALDRLYKMRTPEGVLTYLAYRRMRGVEGALGRHATAAYVELDPAARALFGQLVGALTYSTEGEPTRRRRCPVAELSATEEMRKLTEYFVAARLLTAEAGPDGEPIVSLAHETLFTRWRELAAWVKQNEELLRARTHFAVAAARWEEMDQTPSFLIQAGHPLRDAQAAANAFPGTLTQQQRTFLRASTIRAKRRRVLSALALSMAVLATLWVVYKQVRDARKGIAELGGTLSWESVKGAARGDKSLSERKRQFLIGSLDLTHSMILLQFGELDDSLTVSRSAIEALRQGYPEMVRETGNWPQPLNRIPEFAVFAATLLCTCDELFIPASARLGPAVQECDATMTLFGPKFSKGATIDARFEQHFSTLLDRLRHAREADRLHEALRIACALMDATKNSVTDDPSGLGNALVGLDEVEAAMEQWRSFDRPPAKTPKHVLWALAAGSRQLGEADKARAYLARLDANSTNADSIARCHPSPRHARAMEDVLVEARAKTPAEEQFLRSLVRLALKRPEEALALIDAALQLEPGNASCHNLRAEILEALQRPEEALAAFGRAVELDGKHAGYRAHRGYLAAKMGKLELARKDFEQALRLEDSEILHRKFAWSLLNLRQPAEALRHFDWVKQRDRDAKQDADLQCGLAIAHWQLGSRAEAGACFQRAMAKKGSLRRFFDAGRKEGWTPTEIEMLRQLQAGILKETPRSKLPPDLREIAATLERSEPPTPAPASLRTP